MALVWESYKLDPYVQKLAEAVFNFQEKVQDVSTKWQEPVAQKVDDAIHWRNLYPVHNAYWFPIYLSGGYWFIQWIVHFFKKKILFECQCI